MAVSQLPFFLRLLILVCMFFGSLLGVLICMSTVSLSRNGGNEQTTYNCNHN
jgi:hypothetical protein